MLSLRGDDGPATVEEVHSGRVAHLDSFADAPAQIACWLRDDTTAAPVQEMPLAPEPPR